MASLKLSKPLSITSVFTLSSGHSIPALGLGFFRTPDAAPALESFKLGYRHIDSARYYHNEGEMGAAVHQSGIPRDEIFCTSKVMSYDYSSSSSISSAIVKVVESSLSNFKWEYFDLYLLHDPNAGSKGRIEAWKGLEKAVEKGYVKSIGVSNFGVAHLQQLLASNPKIRPAINQIEVHPWCQQREIREFCDKEGILVQAYCPLVRGHKMSDPTLRKVAERHNKTPAQILIRWCLQHDLNPLPKSSQASRIKENADVFDFELSKDDMEELDALDEGARGAISWNPVNAP
ncbi:Aldo/keto reductase [Atractiella rhizophila]|nr:Aldo/keto reductase [Atractiella rhizophila]